MGLMTAIRHVTEAVKEVEARGASDDSDASVQVVAVVLEKLGHAHLFDNYMGVVNSRDPAPDGTFKDMVMKMVAEESAAVAWMGPPFCRWVGGGGGLHWVFCAWGASRVHPWHWLSPFPPPPTPKQKITLLKPSVIAVLWPLLPVVQSIISFLQQRRRVVFLVRVERVLMVRARSGVPLCGFCLPTACVACGYPWRLACDASAEAFPSPAPRPIPHLLGTLRTSSGRRRGATSARTRRSSCMTGLGTAKSSAGRAASSTET